MTRSSTDVESGTAMAALFMGDYYRDVLDEVGVESVAGRRRVSVTQHSGVVDYGSGLRSVIVRLHDELVIDRLHDEQLRGVLESRGWEAL